MSPESFNHTMPRGLLPRQLKVLGFLDHLSWSNLIHFTNFCGLGCHPQWNINMYGSLGTGVICLLWTWRMFWVLLTVGCCGKWVLSRACRYWKRNSLHLSCATDSFQIITLDFEIENVQIQSWFESPLRSDLCQIRLTLHLYKLSDGIR